LINDETCKEGAKVRCNDRGRI